MAAADAPAKPGPGSSWDWGSCLPVLSGPRVRLRPLGDADVPDLFTIFSDPEVMRYWSRSPMSSRREAEDLLAEVRWHFDRRTLFQWGVVRQADDRLVGSCTLHRWEAAQGRAELGYALGRAHWGQGWMSEAVTCLVGFAFGSLGLHRMEADTDPRNARSVRLLERLGFRREGVLRERYHVNDEWQDSLILGLLQTEWRPPAADPGPQSA